MFGPNILIFVFLKKSTIPFTSGFSGPTINRVIFFSKAFFLISLKLSMSISIFLAIKLVPAFPGKQYIFLTKFESLIFRHKACSRPPLPIIPTFIYIIYITKT